MTLGELATVAKVEEVLISNVLKNLEVENSEEFCRYRIAKYLESTNFKNDSILALDKLFTRNVPLKDFSLKFLEKSLGNLQLIATYEIEESL